MSHTARATPRSGKFAHLKNIRGEGSARRPDRGVDGSAATRAAATTGGEKDGEVEADGAVSSTLVALDRQHEDVAIREDTEERVRRYRYAQTVLRLVEQAGEYHSIGLFVEAMLGELGSGVTDVPTRAAVGTWALNLLATQSSNGALAAIAAALLPAIYCQYTPDALCQPSAAIQAQVRDPAILQSNPYFTHSMYVEQLTVDRDAVETITAQLRRAIAANDARRDHVVRRVSVARSDALRVAFRAWRAQVRRAAALASTNANRSKRQEASMRRVRLQAVFYQWKMVLEESRNAFLTERLHEAAGQLENAKNQFQLQCYRADRLIQAGKHMKDQLTAAHDANAALQRRVRELEVELVQQEKDFNAKLAHNVAAALRLVQSYERLVTALCETRRQPLRYQVEQPDADASLTEEEQALYGTSSDRNSRGSPTLVSASDGGDGAAAAVEGQEETGGGTGTPPLPANRETPSDVHAAAATRGGEERGRGAAGEDAAAAAMLEEETVMETLLRWCNSVLREVRGVHSRAVTNFSRDFASGEVYLVLLHATFPETTSLLVNQESNVEYRLRRIRDMCVKSCLVHVLDPDDFINKREDKIIQSLCELYGRHVDVQWKANAVATAARFTKELRVVAGDQPDDLLATAAAAAEGEPQVEVSDDASFQRYVAQCGDRLAAMKEELLQQCYLEEELACSREQVTKEEARLVEEERKGLPLLLVGAASTRPFWQLKLANLSDLRDAEKVGHDAVLWPALTTGPLPRVLKRCAPMTSRLFYFYAGGGRSMAEYAFWRFVETHNLCAVADLTKEVVASVFDRVASPQLAAAIKAASFGRIDMDRQTLMNVARQELDIRHINPSQFVELLVRLALEVHGRALGLVEGVAKLIRDIPLPRASLLAPAQAAFYAADSQYVIHFFSDDIARIYFFYLKRQESSKVARERAAAVQDGGRFAGLLAVATFTRMLDDCAFLADSATASEAMRGGLDSAVMAGAREANLHSAGSAGSASPILSESASPAFPRRARSLSGAAHKSRGFVSSAQVQELLTTLSKPYTSLRPGEITFTVFLEGLAAVSHYWCPNPLIPPSRKLAAFLVDYITQLSSRHASSTLILGAPPHVPLEGGPKVDLTLRAGMLM